MKLKLIVMLTLFLSATLFNLGYAAKTNVSQKRTITVVSANAGLLMGGPDLIVSRLEYANKEIRFRIKNIGRGTKKPGQLGYSLKIQTLNSSNRVVSTRNYTGVAALASISRLRRGQESGDNRITRANLPLNMIITLCINKGLPRSRLLRESNTRNNCLSKNTVQLLPDLEVGPGHLVLYKPDTKGGFFRNAGHFVVDLVSGNAGFDTRGILDDAIRVYIRNRGKVAVHSFRIYFSVVIRGKTGQTYTRQIRKKLLPGKSIRIDMWVGRVKERYYSKRCCFVMVAVDPANSIREVNESNNKKILTVIRKTVHH